jgi:BirA family biotin operon repressor/biotin-[acetyl-CoA-carboxylase] ligase
MPDEFLDADTIRASSFVRHVEIHDSLGSTNDRAIELARDLNVHLPALVVARRQTAGRGRGSNTWWSAEGALTFSLLLDPSLLAITVQCWPKLSLCTAVAICDALRVEIQRVQPGKTHCNTNRSAEGEESSVPQSRKIAIKWPNDVMLNDAKVCGLLIESPAGSPDKKRLVIGVGLNVNNSLDRAPSAVGSTATSLSGFTGRQHSLPHLIGELLNHLEMRLGELGVDAPVLPREWQRLSWLDGRRLRVNSATSDIEGICIGIDLDGALLLETAKTIKRVYSGSIQLL